MGSGWCFKIKNNKRAKKVVLITGCTSGIGLETAILLSKKFIVYAGVRKRIVLGINRKKSFKFNLLQLDVKSNRSINQAVKKIIKKEGKIDILINNAGYGLIGPLETINIEQAKSQFETNFFGAIKTIKATLSVMKAQRSGLIINVSSVAGVIGSKLMSMYCSSKFALEGLSESLYDELKPFGIRVKVVEPGKTVTNFKQNITRFSVSGENEYSFGKQKKFDALNPKAVAKLILFAINDKQDKLRYQIGKNAMLMIKQKLKNPSDFSSF